MRTILSKDSCCIDIGANMGSILSEIVGLCPDGKHYAFEPIPELAADLKRRFPFVGVHDVALSDEDGEATFFHVENDPGYSGLRKRRYDVLDPIIREIRINKDRLDKIIPLGQRIDFIKIDVEGGELPVLRGARRILEENSPSIVFESGKGASDFYGTTAEALFDFLVEQHNFELYTLDGFLSGCSSLTMPKLVDAFDETKRYYFVAVGRKHLRISLADRMNSYLLDLDMRLFALERRLPKKSTIAG